MDLYIAEKPSVAEAIASALPGSAQKGQGAWTVGNATVTWCYGHLLEQAQPHEYDPIYEQWDAEHLPIVPKAWRLKPRTEDYIARQLKVVRELLSKCTRVINAGDADAEGQLLVDEVLEHFKNNKPVMRVLCSSLELPEVRKALTGLESNSAPRYVGWREWARCRSRLDWLIGMNMSRAYTLRARITTPSFRGVLSVGRVQTPTLALIVQRDEAIDNFKSVPFFVPVAAVTHKGVTFAARWKARDGQPGLDEDGRLIDAGDAQKLVDKLTDKPGIVSLFEYDAKKSAPPMPHDLASLQMICNEQYGYSAAKVLEIAQALYETHKITTYPRTDKRYITIEQHNTAAGRLAAVRQTLPTVAGLIEGANLKLKTSAVNDSEATPHHGIIPTQHGIVPTALDDAQRNVFEEIVRAFIAQFYPAHEYDETTCEITIGSEIFRAKGRKDRVLGWKTVFKPQVEDAPEDSDDSKQAIPTLTRGEQITHLALSLDQRKTSAPKRFTERLLLSAMMNIAKYVQNPAAKARLNESSGIGTPATRANIIEELKKRQFIETKGKQLISTPEGRALVHALPVILTDAGFTGMTEQTLDQVAASKLQSDVFIAKSADLIRSLVTQAKSAAVKMPEAPTVPCPQCKTGQLSRRKGSNGHFWGCSEYKNGCKATYEDKRGKPALVKGASTKKRSGGSKTATGKLAPRAPRAPRQGGAT